jgi:outer membrane lipoprotein-sorting protein
MVWRSILALAAVCALAVSSVAAQQSVDELIAKNLEAKGGLAKLNAVQSMKQVSQFSMSGMAATMTVYSKRPNRVRQEVKIGGQTVISAFDGVTTWVVNPMVGSSRPIAVTGPQADMLREQGDFDGPLVDYKTKGYTVELVGPETLGERKVNHLKLVSPSRQIVHVYLDASTNLEAKRATEVESLKLEQELGDYRPVDGVMIPFHIRLLVNGVPQSEMKVESVQFNVTMDDAIFRMPKG